MVEIKEQLIQFLLFEIFIVLSTIINNNNKLNALIFILIYINIKKNQRINYSILKIFNKFIKSSPILNIEDKFP